MKDVSIAQEQGALPWPVDMPGAARCREIGSY